MRKTSAATAFALLAALLYAVSAPFSKLLLREIPPTMMAAFLYLGAGLGMALVGLVRQAGGGRLGMKLTRRELPYTAAMVALDIAAPILLMVGLTMTTAANASLLNNFEIVSTAIIARLLFRESIGRRLWLAIGLITLSSLILSFEDASSLSFSGGSLFVLMACTCWGLENNCTRVLSEKDPLQIVVIKGLGSGAGSLLLALVLGERLANPPLLLAAMLLGFVAYGLSIFFYVLAQRQLGAARTSACYAVSSFVGAALSLLLLRELPSPGFWAALSIMVAGVLVSSSHGKPQPADSGCATRGDGGISR